MQKRFIVEMSTLLLLCASMPVNASTDYQPSGSLEHSMRAICHREVVALYYTTRGTPGRLGLNRLVVNGEHLPPSEVDKVNTLLQGQRLASVEYLGCRRTRSGDVRHWLQMEPGITPQNAQEPTRSKAFYIRSAKVEFHDKQPVD